MLTHLKKNSQDKTVAFVSEVSPESGSTSKMSSTKFKDSYLKHLFHTTIPMIRGRWGQKIMT